MQIILKWDGTIHGLNKDINDPFILKEFLNDSQPVVSESCAVALDAMEYWAPTKYYSTEEQEE